MSKLSSIALRKIAAESEERNPYDDVLNQKSGLGEYGAQVGTRLITSAVPGVNLISGPAYTIGDLIGTIAGLAQDKDKLPSEEQLSKLDPKSLLPGVYAYRGTANDRRVDSKVTDGKVDRKGILMENFAGIPANLLLALALVGGGGAIGSALSDDKLLGATAGAGVGGALMGAGALTAALVGLLRKRRSAAEHKDYLLNDLDSNWAPLAGMYNQGRRARMKLESSLS